MKEAHYKNNPEWKWSSKDKKMNRKIKTENNGGMFRFLATVSGFLGCKNSSRDLSVTNK